MRRAARAADKGAQGAATGAGIPAAARAGARGAPGLLGLALGPCSAFAHLGAVPQLPSARRRGGRGSMPADGGRRNGAQEDGQRQEAEGQPRGRGGPQRGRSAGH